MDTFAELQRKRAGYLEKEDAARRKATYSAEPEDRQYWLRVAHAWRNLAEQTEKTMAMLADR